MSSSSKRSDGGCDPLNALLQLHVDVDRAASSLAARHKERLQCGRGCSDCCMDDLTVFEIEAERIRRAHGDLLERGEPHPSGGCAFLDADGACRIYADRPYVCRTQGLPLVHFEEIDEDDVSEHRSICELNAVGPPLNDLRLDELWVIGPHELLLAQAQQQHGTGQLERVGLRSLFKRRARGSSSE